ncbi:MAG: hypothetical protein MUO26_09145 [Methanotrichaceae archaeon]|nr:hypothetical protein [Methanotrichaceae archaeon]
MTAACSVISFNLIYPSPVAVTLSSSLNVPPEDLLAAGIPISMILFAIGDVYMLRLPAEGIKHSECIVPSISRARAWIPLAVTMILIVLGIFSDKLGLIGNPSIALLSGALICLALAKDKIRDMIHSASRRAGVIMLDLCGAGALG